MSNLIINEHIQVPWSELRFTAVRSSGPGGQNVNKVNSKVQLQWHVAATDAISDDVRERLIKNAGALVSTTGWLTISSQTSRRQRMNRDECIRKLRTLILTASKRRKPRKATRPSKASQVRRRRCKQQTSEKKKRRRPPNIDD